MPTLGSRVFDRFPFALVASKFEIEVYHVFSGGIESPLIGDTFEIFRTYLEIAPRGTTIRLW
jgi:hypothetical protein